MNRRITLLAFAVLLCATVSAQKIAIVADKLYTVGGEHKAGAPGVVLVDNGKIASVTEGNKAPQGYTVLRATVVTPGLIDVKSALGISGEFNVPGDQDVDEATDPNTADVRAYDSYNPDEALIKFANSYGVTTIQTSPGIINPIAGQAAIFKTVGPKSAETTVLEASLRPASAMIFNLGETPKSYGEKGKAPGTRMATAAIIRKALSDAQNYERKWDDWNKNEKKDYSKQPARDPKLEALLPVLKGELPVIFNAYRSDDIVTALRIAQEYHLKPIISSATEGYLIPEELKKAGATVFVGPTLQRNESLETENATVEEAAMLERAGIPVALMTGFEGYVPKTRVLLFEAGVAAANGLGFDNALRACTLDAAKALGLDKQIGSLEPGKDADLVLYDGDPFEYTSHVTSVLVNGKVTYQQ